MCPEAHAAAQLIRDDLANKVSYIDFWSAKQATTTITGAASDVNVPDIVVSQIPANATILRVIGLFLCRAMEDTSGAANAINGAINIRIKKSTGVWDTDDIVLIPIVDNQWAVAAATKEGGDGQVAEDNDASGEVDGNATYNVRFDGVQADGANLVLIDAQVGVRVYFI